MKDGERVKATTREAWRTWLARHHATSPGVWLVFTKKHTGKRLPYADAVEEALCFGWIDGIARRLDEDHYMQRFTPRRNVRNWSKVNLERFARMEAAGLMTDAGRTVRPRDLRPPPRRLQASDPTPRFVAAALAKSPAAREVFRELPPSYRRDYLRWITEAKKPETRDRRLREAIRLLESGRRRLFDPGNPR